MLVTFTGSGTRSVGNFYWEWRSFCW